MYDDYKLSPSEHQKVFERICLDLFSGRTPVANPEIFILGGQPGAGKSFLTHKIRQTFQTPNIVVINSDEFRLMHPQAQEIFNQHDKDFAQYTDPDVRTWAKNVFDKAIAERYNIIFEGTMRTQQICETIKHLQQENYKIHVMAMAVHEIKSRISIYSRYQEQLDQYPIARFTSRFSHDAAYHGMLDTLNKIEKEHLYDTITIYNREGEVVFQTGDKNIVKAILSEREKPFSTKDKDRYSCLCQTLLAKMEARQESPIFIEDLNTLYQAVLSQNGTDILQKSVVSMAAKVHSLRTAPAYSSARLEQKQQTTELPIAKINLSRDK